MDTEELIKYLVWIVFFALALTGIYLLLRKIGVI